MAIYCMGMLYTPTYLPATAYRSVRGTAPHTGHRTNCKVWTNAIWQMPSRRAGRYRQVPLWVYKKAAANTAGRGAPVSNDARPGVRAAALPVSSLDRD